MVLATLRQSLCLIVHHRSPTHAPNDRRLSFIPERCEESDFFLDAEAFESVKLMEALVAFTRDGI